MRRARLFKHGIQSFPDLVNIEPMILSGQSGRDNSSLEENSEGKYLSLNGFYFWNSEQISIIKPEDIEVGQEYTMYLKGSLGSTRRMRFFDENKDEISWLTVSNISGATAENPAEVNFDFTPPTGTRYVTLYAGGNPTRINIFAMSIFKSEFVVNLQYNPDEYTYEVI